MATNYIWNSVTDNVLAEVDDSGAVQATYTQEPGLYGSVVSQQSSGVTSYYQFDGQGSTRQLTDADQNVTDAATYSAFGEQVDKTGTTENSWWYKGASGYYTNPTSAELYVRARAYQPILDRWLSKDPIQSLQQYAYVRQNPLNLVDPSGQSEVEGGPSWRDLIPKTLYFDRELYESCYKFCTSIVPFPSDFFETPRWRAELTRCQSTCYKWGGKPKEVKCPKWLDTSGKYGYPDPKITCQNCKLSDMQSFGEFANREGSILKAGWWIGGRLTGSFVFDEVADCCCNWKLPVKLTVPFDIKVKYRVSTKWFQALSLLDPTGLARAYKVGRALRAVVQHQRFKRIIASSGVAFNPSTACWLGKFSREGLSQTSPPVRSSITVPREGHEYGHGPVTRIPGTIPVEYSISLGQFGRPIWVGFPIDEWIELGKMLF